MSDVRGIRQVTRLLIVLATVFVLCCGDVLASSTVRWSPWQAEKRLVRGGIRWDDGTRWVVSHARCVGTSHASVGTNGGRRYARFDCRLHGYESFVGGISSKVQLTPISRTRYKVRRGWDQRTGHQATPK